MDNRDNTKVVPRIPENRKEVSGSKSSGGESKLAESRKILTEHYRDWRNGDITVSELTAQCAYWTVDHALDSYKFRPMSTIPFEVQQFKQLSDWDKRRMDPVKREKVERMASRYKEEVLRIEHQNKSDLVWLKECLRIFEKRDDEAYAETIRRKIWDYEEKGVRV